MNTLKVRHFEGRRRRKGFLTASELLAQLPGSMLGYKNEVVGPYRYIRGAGVAHVHTNN